MSEFTSSGGSAVSGPEPRARGKRLSRRIAKLICVLAVLGAATALALPSILSTSLGRGWIVSSINGRIAGKARIGSLRLAWFGGQKIGDFTLVEPDGGAVLAFKEFSTDATLWALAFGGNFDLGKTRLAGLDANVRAANPNDTSKSGATNLQQALAARGGSGGAKSKKPKPSSGAAPGVPLSLKGSVSIEGARLEFSKPGLPPVALSNLAATARIISVKQPIRFDLSCTAEQEKRAGSITAKGTITDLFDKTGKADIERTAVNAALEVKDAPVDLFDQLAGAQGRLRAALGPALNVSFESAGSSGKMGLFLLAKSQNMRVDLRADMTGGRIALAQPAQARLTLSPELVRALSPPDASGAAAGLTAPADLVLILEELSVPFGPAGAASASIKARAALGDLRLKSVPGVGDIAVRGLQASFDSARLGKEARLGLNGTIEQGAQASHLEVDAAIRDCLDEKGALRLDAMQADVTAKLPNVPTALIDRLAGQKGRLAAALGPNLSLSIDAKSAAGKREARLSLNSERLAFDAPLKIGEEIALASPAEAKYTVSPEFVKALSPSAAGPRLSKDTAVILKIDRFAAPLSAGGSSAYPLDKVSFGMSLSAGVLALSGMGDAGQIGIQDFNVQLGGSMAALEMNASASVAQEAAEGLLNQLAGPKTSIKVAVQAGVKSGQFTVPKANFQIASERLNASAEGSMTAGKLALAQPAKIDLSLSPALLKRFSKGKTEGPRLAKPANIRIVVEPFGAPIAAFDPGGLKIAAKATIDEIALAGGAAYEGVSIRETVADVTLDGKGNAARLVISGKTSAPGQAKSAGLKADVSAKNVWRDGVFSLAGAALESDVRADSFPVALAEAFSGMGGRLTPLLGPSLSAKIAAKLPGGAKSSGTAKIEASSERLTLESSLRIGETLSLDTPVTIKLKVTPEGFASLSAPKAGAASGQDLALASPAQFEARIESLRFPLGKSEKEKAGFDPSKAAFSASVSAPKLAFQSKSSGRALEMSKFELKASSESLSRLISFSLTGGLSVQGAQGAAQAGALDAKAEIGDLFTSSGVLAAQGASVKVDASLGGLPVAELERALGGQGKLAALLGDTAGIGIATQIKKMAGPINANIKGTAAQVQLAALLSSSGLTLKEPFTADVTVTPQLGKELLKSVNPLLVSAVGAQQPVKLSIPTEGFLVPVSAPVLPGIKMPQARLELGTIMLQNGGVLKGLLQLLRVNMGEQVPARFSPVLARMDAGVATYEPVEVVIGEQIRVITWGTVDLVRDMVDMKLGVTADTLERVAGIHGLAANSALVCPMRGPTRKVTVDWTKAIKDLAMLGARSQLEKSAGGLGGLLGGALGGKIPGAAATPQPTAPTVPQNTPQSN